MSLPTALAARVSQSSSRTMQQKVIVAEYGDGHSQTAALGINSRYDEWNLTFNHLNDTLRNAFHTFYADVGLVKTWMWTPPGETVAKKWRITTAPVETTDGGCTYNISMTVRQIPS